MSEITTVNTTISNLIHLTDSAKVRILELLDHSTNPNLKLRVYVDGSCCSGFEYYFAFEEKLEEDHTLLAEQELEIIADPISIKYLIGTTLDYSSNGTISGFTIINPKVKKECGCSHTSCHSSCC